MHGLSLLSIRARSRGTGILTDTMHLLGTSYFIGPGYHAALLFSWLGSIVLLFVLLFLIQSCEALQEVYGTSILSAVYPSEIKIFKKVGYFPDLKGALVLVGTAFKAGFPATLIFPPALKAKH